MRLTLGASCTCLPRGRANAGPRRPTVAWAAERSSGDPSTSTSSSDQNDASGQDGAKEIKMPKTGWLKMADPNQPVRPMQVSVSVAWCSLATPVTHQSCLDHCRLTVAQVYSKSTEPFDPSKKGGRYKSEFIWNTNWQVRVTRAWQWMCRHMDDVVRDKRLTHHIQQLQETLKRDEQLQRQRREYVERQKSGQAEAVEEVGTVGFGLLSQLDRMDVDLTSVLVKKKERVEGGAGTASAGMGESQSGRGQAGAKLTKMQMAQAQASASSTPLSRGNTAKLQRSGRLTRNAVSTVVSTKAEDDAEKRALAEAERIKYEGMKRDFQIWTLAMTVLGVASTYNLYGRDVAGSYLVGALGGYFYLRLLSKSVDAVGGSGSVEGNVSGMASQPRLLIPVILALVYNRWNQLYADRVDLTLQLLPMLVGFFTYKIAVLARESKDLLADLSIKPKDTN